MKACTLCGDLIYSSNDGPICYRCREMGAHVRLEIYDKETGITPEDSFSKAFIGGPHFKDMQRRNIRRGNFSEAT